MATTTIRQASSAAGGRRWFRPVARSAGAAAMVGALLFANCVTAAPSFADTPDDLGSSAAIEQPAVVDPNGPDGVQVQSSRRFTINNLTGHKLKLTSIDGDKKFEGAPNVGDVIQPAAAQFVEVTYVYGSTQRDDFNYDVLGADGSVVGKLHAHLELKSSPLDAPVRSTGCDVWESTGTCDHDAESVTFKDAHDTKRTATADSPEGAAILAQFCVNGVPSLSCTFTPTSAVDHEAFGPRHTVGTPVFNNTSRDSNWAEYRIDESESTTNNIQANLNIQAQLGPILQASVNLGYGYSWTNSVNRGQTLHIDMSPYTKNWVESTNPVVRVNGNFTMVLGNTTWTVTGATFEVPDSTRKSSDVVQTRPMTDQERADMAPTVVAVTSASTESAG